MEFDLLSSLAFGHLRKKKLVVVKAEFIKKCINKKQRT
jgi:hypothetical protein